MSILIHKEKGAKSTIFCLKFSKDSRLLFAGTMKEVLVFDVLDRLKARRAKFGSIPFYPALGVDCLKEGFVSCHSDGYIMLWQEANCEKYVKDEEMAITTIVVSHSEVQFLTGYEYGLIKVWDADLAPVKTIDLDKMLPLSIYNCVTALDMDEQSRVLIGLKSGEIV
jgi:hypothetical protein